MARYTDVHEKVARAAGVSREVAKKINFVPLYGVKVKSLQDLDKLFRRDAEEEDRIVRQWP